MELEEAIKDKPIKVYKYHKFDKNLFSIIENGELWFSHQEKLNDILDCKYELSKGYLYSLFENTSNTILKDLQEISPNFTNIKLEDFRKQLEPIFNDNDGRKRFYDMLLRVR